VNQTVLASPAGISFGKQLFPHTDDQPVTRTVTYRNSGSATVTLNLALHVTGPDGKPVTGFERKLKHSDVATVRAEHAQQATGVLGHKVTVPELPNILVGGFLVETRFQLPFTRTEYYNTDDGVQWHRTFDEVLGGRTVTRTFGPPVGYTKGKTTTERWNRAVFGPSVVAPPGSVSASRQGDQLVFFQPTFVDRDGRETQTLTTVERTQLFRNGDFVNESPSAKAVFDVPAERAAYRVEVLAGRGAPATLSTFVATAWTFRSGHVSGEVAKPLPLSVVLFTPALDARNSAPAGQRFAIPVTVVAQAGSDAGANRSLTVEVSYDDGATWRRASLQTSGGVRSAMVNHPAAAGFVSLRATATDTKGNTVTVTIIRAYRMMVRS
jgi:hypothetical protein